MGRKIIGFDGRCQLVASSLIRKTLITHIYYTPVMNLVITGATSGIGMETVKALAPRFGEIFLLVRNREKAEKLLAGWSMDGSVPRFHIVACDLEDLQTVVAAAEKIKSEIGKLDVLINNAGAVHKSRQLTKDGLESSFSINHLGHFLLTRQLMPLLLAGDSARIINLSSEAHKIAKPDFEDLQFEKSYHPLMVYANVKLFNILFTRSLAERYGASEVHAFALHPGMVRTSFGSGFTGIIKLGMKLIKPLLTSPRKGAQTSVFLATDPSVLAHNGGYFKKKKLSRTSKAAESHDLRDRLWEASEELLQVRGI